MLYKFRYIDKEKGLEQSLENNEVFFLWFFKRLNGFHEIGYCVRGNGKTFKTKTYYKYNKFYTDSTMRYTEIK